MRLFCNKPVLPKFCLGINISNHQNEFVNFVGFSLQLNHFLQRRAKLTTTVTVWSLFKIYLLLLPQSLLQLLFSPFVECYIYNTIIKCLAISEIFSFKINQKHCLPRIQFEYQVFQTYMRYTSSIISYHSNQRT